MVRHEAEHLRRRDAAVQLLQAVAKAVWFFHPLAHLLDRRLDDLREMVCDDAAAGTGREGALDYSRHLVEIAESLVSEPPRGLPMNALVRRGNDLSTRIRYQIDAERRRVMSPTRIVLVSCAAILLALSLSWREGEGGGKAHAATAEPRKAAPAGDPIVLEVEGSGEIRVDGETTTSEELSVRLAARIEPGELMPVVDIHCTDSVPMRTVHHVHLMLRAEEMNRVRYCTADGKCVPLLLPTAELLARTEELPKEDLAVLALDANGSMTLDGRKIGKTKLAEAVAARIGANHKIVVSVETDGDTRYGAFVLAMTRLREAGAKRVVVQPPAGDNG